MSDVYYVVSQRILGLSPWLVTMALTMGGTLPQRSWKGNPGRS